MTQDQALKLLHEKMQNQNLRRHFIGVSELGKIPEPEENGSSFAEIAKQKALHYAKHVGEYVC